MKRYAWTFLPAMLAALCALAWQTGIAPNPIVYLRADSGTLVLLLGVTASSLACAFVALREAMQHRAAHTALRLEASHQQAHRRFMSRLDHEIKNPLTAIRAGLANLDGSETPALQTIHSQVDRLARLSGDLRKLADIEAHALEQEPIDLPQLLNELIALENETAEPAQRTLTLALFETPFPLSQIVGDRDLLFIAFHNLVENAIKFSRPHDKIEVRAFEDGAFVTIEVADTGPGISDDDLPHLGEELYRGSATKTIPGSGLGLAIVRAIVARHSGAFAVRSRLGQGTVVTIRLPVARA